MDCVLCRPFRWLGIKHSRDCVADQRALQQKFQSWRYAQTNDAQLFADDPDPTATRKAAVLCRTDPDAALPELTTLAERGSIWCMGLLGYCYQVGRGIAVDLAEAERWYRRAFDRGSQQAQLRLGRMVEQRGDFAECERIYAIGVADQWAPAMYYLARIKLRKPRTLMRMGEARRLLKRAAAQGDLGAAIELGRMTAKGEFGIWQIPGGWYLLVRATRKAVALLDDGVTPPGLQAAADKAPLTDEMVTSPGI